MATFFCLKQAGAAYIMILKRKDTAFVAFKIWLTGTAVTLQLQMLIFTTCANRERILCKQVLGASVQVNILNL
jgi:hypothetical protein